VDPFSRSVLLNAAATLQTCRRNLQPNAGDIGLAPKIKRGPNETKNFKNNVQQRRRLIMWFVLSSVEMAKEHFPGFLVCAAMHPRGVFSMW